MRELITKCPAAWLFGRAPLPFGLTRALDIKERVVLAQEMLRDIYKKWRSAQPVVCVICIVPTAQSQRWWWWWCRRRRFLVSEQAFGPFSLPAAFVVLPTALAARMHSHKHIVYWIHLRRARTGPQHKSPRSERFCAWTIPFSIYSSLSCAVGFAFLHFSHTLAVLWMRGKRNSPMCASLSHTQLYIGGREMCWRGLECGSKMVKHKPRHRASTFPN